MVRLAGFILLSVLLPSMAQAQQQSPTEGGQPGNAWNQSGREGGRGSGPIDPTKNVLDLVEAAIRRQDDLRAAEAKLQEARQSSEAKLNATIREADAHRLADLRDADVRRLNELREAETRRVNELATQKQIFDLELARVIRAGLDASTLLLATQLKEVKTDASDRMAKLEQFANEQRGRASATDPGYAKALEEIKALTASRTDLAGRSSGIEALIGWIVAGIMLLLAIGGFVINMNRNHPAARSRP